MKRCSIFFVGLLLWATGMSQWMFTESKLYPESFENEKVGDPSDNPALRWVKSGALNTRFFDNEITLNASKTDRKSGVIEGFSGTGNLYFVTGYSKNKIDGNWESRYSNGSIRDAGKFYQNIPDGEWKGYYPNGQVKFVRQYSALKWFAMQRQLTRRNAKQRFYTLVAMAMKNTGAFSKLASAQYSFQTLAKEAAYYEPPFAKCLHHGVYMNYYQNGIMKDSGYYHEGLRDGVWQSWYPTGVKQSSGIYINGEKHSGWASFNERGEMTMLREYRYGQLIYEKQYKEWE